MHGLRMEITSFSSLFKQSEPSPSTYDPGTLSLGPQYHTESSVAKLLPKPPSQVLMNEILLWLAWVNEIHVQEPNLQVLTRGDAWQRFKLPYNWDNVIKADWVQEAWSHVHTIFFTHLGFEQLLMLTTSKQTRPHGEWPKLLTFCE